MERGNVVVIGNSGVGKSTLINAVLGEQKAETNFGTKGTTDHLRIYTNEQIPFQIIDTQGFEPTFIKSRKAVNQVKKWSKQSLKDENKEQRIHAIWFCVDGTARKLFPDALKNLAKATSLWKSVPVIVVITKSYSEPERVQNIELVHQAFEKDKQFKQRIKAVIPVVAEIYVINEEAYAAPTGIDELIEATNNLMPAGIKAAEADVKQFKLNRKRAMAHGLTVTATTSAAVVGAIPIPIADAVILGPIEVSLVNSLGKIYEIGKGEDAEVFKKSIVDVGTVGALAKGTTSLLKAIPGINIGAAVLNSVIAASVVAALGEATIYIFEQVYLGKKEVTDISWAVKMIEAKISPALIEKLIKILKEQGGQLKDPKTIAKIVSALFKN